MRTDVLVGEGEPRIVLTDDTNEITSAVVSVIRKVVTLSAETVLDATVINRQFISKNENDAVTKGKIVAYNNVAHTIEVDFFDNDRPVAEKAVTITNKIIDLPYCTNNLVENFRIDAYPTKKLWNTGELVIKIKGYYYEVTLDYSSYADLEMLQSMQPIYLVTNTEPFTFYPRKDNSLVNYKCKIDPEHVFQIAQLKHHQGHMLVVFKFKGIERLNQMELTKSLKDVNNYGYGKSFGKGYGHTGW